MRRLLALLLILAMVPVVAGARRHGRGQPNPAPASENPVQTALLELEEGPGEFCDATLSLAGETEFRVLVQYRTWVDYSQIRYAQASGARHKVGNRIWHWRMIGPANYGWTTYDDSHVITWPTDLNTIDDLCCVDGNIDVRYKVQTDTWLSPWIYMTASIDRFVDEPTATPSATIATAFDCLPVPVSMNNIRFSFGVVLDTDTYDSGLLSLRVRPIGDTQWGWTIENNRVEGQKTVDILDYGNWSGEGSPPQRSCDQWEALSYTGFEWQWGLKDLYLNDTGWQTGGQVLLEDMRCRWEGDGAGSMEVSEAVHGGGMGILSVDYDLSAYGFSCGFTGIGMRWRPTAGGNWTTCSPSSPPQSFGTMVFIFVGAAASTQYDVEYNVTDGITTSPWEQLAGPVVFIGG